METAAARDLLESGVEHAGAESVLESLMEVANLPEFVFDPAGLDFRLECRERRGGEVIFHQRVEGGFGGEHAALDGEMNAFEALRVEESGGVAEDHPAIARNGRDRPPSAVGQDFAP